MSCCCRDGPVKSAPTLPDQRASIRGRLTEGDHGGHPRCPNLPHCLGVPCFLDFVTSVLGPAIQYVRVALVQSATVHHAQCLFILGTLCLDISALG